MITFYYLDIIFLAQVLKWPGYLEWGLLELRRLLSRQVLPYSRKYLLRLDDDKGKDNAAGQETLGGRVNYSFDSTALERAARAAKEIERSPHAKQALELSRLQEVTKQSEIELQQKVRFP